MSEESPPLPLPDQDVEKKQIAQLEEELKESKDNYLRLLADKENAYKRLQKEKQEMTRFALENFASEMLSPIDNLENALKFAEQMPPDVRNWAMGFQMILNQFKEVLHSNGIVPFASVGTSFDPHKHEAVETEESSAHPEGKVLEEFVKGYKSAERTIRPARVKVSKAPAHQKENVDTPAPSN